MKIKSKRNFEVRHSLKLFSRNLKILASCCDVIMSKLGQKDSNLYIMYKILKTSYWIWYFYHSCNIVYKCGPFSAQFWRYDIKRTVGLFNFRILEKWPKIKFFTSKYLHGSEVRTFHCCLVAVYCFETALKYL